MYRRGVEISVGLFVAIGLSALVMLAMRVSNLSNITRDDGYNIIAHFDNVGGLKVRSPVTLAGVKVGQVSDIKVDSRTYEAVVTMSVAEGYDLPADTGANIFTSGLLGEQYVSLEPGGAEKILQHGDRIRLTQSALVLEQVLGQFLYSQAAGDE